MSSPQKQAPIIRLDRLSLHNFRCFSECTIGFHPHLTVLVAQNGSGKTAILEAVGISLGLFVDTIADTRQTHGFDRSDVLLVYEQDGKMTPVLPTQFKASGESLGKPIEWKRSLNKWSRRIQTSTKDDIELRTSAQVIRNIIEGHAKSNKRQLYELSEELPLILPLVAFYGTGRLWSEHRLTEGKKVVEKTGVGRMSGYTDCLSSSSSFKGVVAWYEATMNAARDPRSTALPAIKRPEKLLAAVREATRIVLEPTGWCVLDWDFENRLLVVENTVDRSRLPLSALSDGIRNMIALVADIAYRCASLNPHLGEDAARDTSGILLIDEIDMHLHPSWQQQVIGLLQKAFPSLQIIVSTHSPHVLSTVDRDSIRVIRVYGGIGRLETPLFQTRGVESADVLATIMGVDPVPQVEEARWLSDYRALIEEGELESPNALELREKIVNHFGIQHPVVLECDRLIRFQSFKIKRNRSEDS
jgi:predicted ATP-binding protein involved in virulence